MSPLEQLPNVYRSFFGKFSYLQPAQKALIQPILDGQDVVLQAGTGLGKTEAVLAPATERLITDLTPFTIVYIVPTRALALDMHRRIQPIYKELGLKSGIRTGDGKTLKEAKPDLLILTPESLDVLVGSQNAANRYFLKHLRVMIIDEAHAFLHVSRGIQLSYLRRRIEIQTAQPMQTLALSATLSSFEEITAFFTLKNVFYYQQTVQRRLEPCWVHIKDERRELAPFFDDLFFRFGCKKLLVFANSRKKCEQVFELLNQEGFFKEHVLLHYSNLSTKERRHIELTFRDHRKGVCIATSTLEMGIDIGDVDGVVLIGPPPSTMAFLQRIGRGNRRKQSVKFWGVCYGGDAKNQLVRFLALFELAKQNRVEKLPVPDDYSVVFQQILSSLYAKKVISERVLSTFFKSKEIRSLVDEMVAKNWLKPMKHPELFYGGWRYGMALKNQQIWSNFPPTDEEYDIVLEGEVIAVLPLSMIKQLEIGMLFQLTGKVLKVLKIEEKKTSREVFVEESDQSTGLELVWYGLGVPISFEVAKKMESILLSRDEPQGLLNRTKKLLEQARERLDQSLLTPSGIRIHCLEGGAYRYETFLGSVGNLILQRLIKAQFSPSIEWLSVTCDELGIESNEWIPLERLQLPDSVLRLQEWMGAHLPFLRQLFSWNSWIRFLPEELQKKEISSTLLDVRIVEHFERYSKESTPHSPPKYRGSDPEIKTNLIPLKGEPWSCEDEKQAWGSMAFPDILSKPKEVSLKASQIQSYVTHRLCSRYAYFQRLHFTVESHPRFCDSSLSRKQEAVAFKAQVIEILQTKHDVRIGFALENAIEEVIMSQKPLFLAEVNLHVNHLKGRPDLIYLKPEGAHISVEVWDIKNGYTFTYDQKWRIAFYAYLLELLLKEKPIKVSTLGGLIYRHQSEIFDRKAFSLVHFKSWMPRLIQKWMSDSGHYSMDSTCTSCSYFSYCYQETLFKMEPKSPTLTSLGLDSNDFPKNTKNWFFMGYDRKSVRWQCWENQESIRDMHLHLEEYPSWSAFQEAVIKELHQQWNCSVVQGKNPHILVYEAADWFRFQEDFQSTSLKSLWAMHTCWTSMQSLLQKHFLWPIEGQITATQVARCLGLISHKLPLLSFYHGGASVSCDVYRHIWNWFCSQVKSQRVVIFHEPTRINNYRSIQHQEQESRTHAILEFQKNPLSHRAENFRAIGPIRFIGLKSNGYCFSFDSGAPIAKFRPGDFLKLSPIDSSHIQEGYSVILESYSPEKGVLSLSPLAEKFFIRKTQLYALDECATDWNAPKIQTVLDRLKDPKFRSELIHMLHGRGKNFPSEHARWAEEWLASHSEEMDLNAVQQKALMLPFLKNIGLIEGPPGTGKTQLLVWTLIALVAHAEALNRTIKILVTAQSHQAIDQVLLRVSKMSPKCSLWKYGRYDQAKFAETGVQPLLDSKTVMQGASFILGATGFGIYQLLEGKNFPQVFDWVIFDEASQVLPSYAFLSLIFGKGNALFYGDTQQLPPVLTADYSTTSLHPSSILQELISQFPHQNRIRLNETYRMNDQICHFVSRHWYDSQLYSAVPKANQQLHLPHYPLFSDSLDRDLDPLKPMVVVQLEHEGNRHSSQEEALWIAKAVKRLIEDYLVPADEIGIISPHRLQNNTILCALKEALPLALKLPKIDTVERMQGQEFDTVVFSATVSDKETIHSAFLKDYRRFNVALTRARKKFLFVASTLFFHSFPMTEKELIAHFPFEDFLHLNSSSHLPL